MIGGGGGDNQPMALNKSYRGVTLYGAVGAQEGNYGALGQDSPTASGVGSGSIGIDGLENGTTSRSEGAPPAPVDRRSAFRSAFDITGDGTTTTDGSLRSSVRNFSSISFRLPGEPCSVRDLGGTATVPTQVFNLAKNIIGAGVLALPSGIAAFGNAPTALVPAAFFMIVTGIIFGYYFAVIGRICKITKTATYREAWEQTVGEAGSSFVAAVVMLKAALGNLSYSMILADAMRSILQSVGVELSRTVVLWGVTLVVLLPLCLLKNLKVLGPFSLVGLGGMLFTGLAMAVRYWDGSYDPSRNGRFLPDLDDHLQPSFGDTGASGALTPQFLVLVVMLFEAFMAHYNAPRFFAELENNTVHRFSVMTTYAFAISVVFFILVATVGFLTFGANSSGFILNNYSSNDSLATISRSAIFIAVATTYPLVFLGTKDGVLDILLVPTELQTSNNLNVLTVLLLGVISIVAVYVTDLGMVAAVGGGTLGTAVVFVFPALMFRCAVRDLSANKVSTVGQRREAFWCLALMCCGIVVGIIGVWMAVTGN